VETGKVKIGDMVQVNFPDINKTIETKVTYVGQTVDRQTRTFNVEVRLPNSTNEFKANMIARLLINDNIVKNAIVVPQNIVQKNAVQKTIDTYGRIDILVNNAGITMDNLLLRMTEEMWDKIMNVNLKSCFNTVKAATRTMMKAKYGSIINMTSVVGAKGNAGQANYAASKAGIIGFTKSVALELGSRNIRCNAVAPGFIETEMTEVLDEKTVQGWRDAIPMKRGGKPEEIADVCVFLGSDMSSYISGQVLHVNGAMYT
jgi:3-oxoacyl-[acyl-carrier protein] reductase